MMGWLEGLKLAADKWNAAQRSYARKVKARSASRRYYLANRDNILASRRRRGYESGNQ